MKNIRTLAVSIGLELGEMILVRQNRLKQEQRAMEYYESEIARLESDPDGSTESQIDLVKHSIGMTAFRMDLIESELKLYENQMTKRKVN